MVPAFTMAAADRRRRIYRSCREHAPSDRGGFIDQDFIRLAGASLITLHASVHALTQIDADLFELAWVDDGSEPNGWFRL
jgi:hypothetical protein